MRATLDLANGVTVSIADDLNCFSVAAYPIGCCNDEMAMIIILAGM